MGSGAKQVALCSQHGQVHRPSDAGSSSFIELQFAGDETPEPFRNGFHSEGPDSECCFCRGRVRRTLGCSGLLSESSFFVLGFRVWWRPAPRRSCALLQATVF